METFSLCRLKWGFSYGPPSHSLPMSMVKTSQGGRLGVVGQMSTFELHLEPMWLHWFFP